MVRSLPKEVAPLPAGGAREREEATPQHGVHQRPEVAAPRSRRDRPPINESTIQQPHVPSRAPLAPTLAPLSAAPISTSAAPDAPPIGPISFIN